VRVIVKHTFIHMDLVSQEQPQARARALTDSVLFDGLNEDHEMAWGKAFGGNDGLSDASTDEAADLPPPQILDGAADSNEEVPKGLMLPSDEANWQAFHPQRQSMEATSTWWDSSSVAGDYQATQLHAAATEWSQPSVADARVAATHSEMEQSPWRMKQRQRISIPGDVTSTKGSAIAEAYNGPYTTVMLRNLPNSLSRRSLLGLIDSQGFAGSYDFVYLPIDFSSQASLGYAFINFCASEHADRCVTHFEGFVHPEHLEHATDKVCTVTWAGPHQGLLPHVDRYRNSPVMHESVPDEWKPVVFSYGKRVAFPPPTQAIRKPKVRRRPDGTPMDKKERRAK
jgi:hypothetical protein